MMKGLFGIAFLAAIPAHAQETADADGGGRVTIATTDVDRFYALYDDPALAAQPEVVAARYLATPSPGLAEFMVMRRITPEKLAAAQPRCAKNRRSLTTRAVARQIFPMFAPALSPRPTASRSFIPPRNFRRSPSPSAARPPRGPPMRRDSTSASKPCAPPNSSKPTTRTASSMSSRMNMSMCSSRWRRSRTAKNRCCARRWSRARPSSSPSG